MSIDTAEKRRSAAGSWSWPFGASVTPNVAKDIEWRSQALWLYSGVGPPDPTVYGGHGEAFSRKRETFNRTDSFPIQRGDQFDRGRESFGRKRGF